MALVSVGTTSSSSVTRGDDGPGVYASDPYYAPPPAPHTEPWHARPSISGYPEEEDAYSRSYRDIDYRRGYDYDYDYDYGYERDRYTPPPPPPPPAGPGGRRYADYERSEYDYDYDYAHEGSYSHPAQLCNTRSHRLNRQS
jgi:hypothetical protein